MKLSAHFGDGIGRIDYTAAGQADADLASAGIALGSVLERRDLTPAQRRDFTSALRATRRAARAVGRHVDVNAVAGGAGDRAE